MGEGEKRRKPESRSQEGCAFVLKAADSQKLTAANKVKITGWTSNIKLQTHTYGITVTVTWLLDTGSRSYIEEVAERK